ncbi:MAG: hypothetical protein ACP5KZ_00765 [bacterium]
MRAFRFLLIFLISLNLFAGELFRLSIQNKVNGEVKISINEGKSWVVLGKVIREGKGVVEGFPASKFGKQGTVVATSSYAIHIKAGEPNSLFSILAEEMREIPKGFGGHIPKESGILTDIKAGTSIFKDLSPTIDSKVFLSNGVGLLELPNDYRLQGGEEIIIVVEERNLPREIVIENERGGKVYLLDGGRREVVARVEKPLSGIGRFDGTEFTGVGRINTVHPGAITVSTVPEEGDNFNYNLSGGFQIVPLYKEAPSYILNSPPYIVVSASPKSAPLFDGTIGLWDFAGQGFKVEASWDGKKWETLPVLKGKIDEISFYLERTFKGKYKGNIRLLKISFPQGDLHLKIREALKRLILQKEKVVRGKLEIEVRIKGEGAQIVELRIDGNLRGIKNFPPFLFSIDTKELEDGEHTIEVLARDSNGETIASQKENIYVDNEGNLKD